MKQPLHAARTALVLVDTQQDFYHAEGAMRRSGFELEGGRSFIESLIRLCDGAREAGVLLVGSAFTVIADTKNDALIPMFVRDMGVRLIRGDFQVSKWGHQVIEEVLPVHYVVDKTGPSAFFRTELDLIMRHRNIDTVIIAGLNSTRSVIATAYDALSLGVRPVIASDGCIDYDAAQHADIMRALDGVFEIAEVNEILASLTAKPVAAQVPVG